MSSLSFTDPLYCQEDNFELEDQHHHHHHHEKPYTPQLTDSEWADVLSSLLTKQHTPPPSHPLNTYLHSVRAHTVSWLLATATRHAFSPTTAVLAVNYLDRCFIPSDAAHGLRIHEDKPWMGRLAAVACLSLAAKVEETRVPLLVDLQLQSSWVFDCKTVRRMELLVLSVLGWRMNPVTPLSFLHHLLLRFMFEDGGSERVGLLVRRTELLLLSVINDWRWVRYSASVWAAAALLHVTGTCCCIAGENAATLRSEETQQLIALLNVPMVKVDECYHLMLEASADLEAVVGHKRKHSCSSVLDYNCTYFQPSPGSVTGSCFICESSLSTSNECWPSSGLSSSETRPFKMPNCTANEALNGEGIIEDNNIFGSNYIATI